MAPAWASINYSQSKIEKVDIYNIAKLKTVQQKPEFKLKFRLFVALLQAKESD